MSAEIIQNWLTAQCSAITGVESGMVAVPMHGSNQTLVVQWPQKPQLKNSLIKSVGAVLKQHKAVLQLIKTAPEEKASPLVIAAPFELSNGQTGAASLVLKNGDLSSGKLALKYLDKELSSLKLLLKTTNVISPVENDEDSSLSVITNLLATALSNKRFDATCAALATELSTQLKCERVSIGIRYHGVTRLSGLSHTAEIKTRHDFSRMLISVMDESIDQQCSVVYPQTGNTSNITLAHNKFSSKQSHHSLCSIPLIFEKEIIGCITLERKSTEDFNQETIELSEHIASFLAPILDMKSKVGRPFWQKVLDTPRTIRNWLASGKGLLGKVVLATFISALVISALPIGSFKVSAPAHIEGLIQRTLTSPEHSYIKEVFTRPGDTVIKGQVLLTLENKELELEAQQLESKLTQLQAKYGNALANRNRTELAVLTGETEETRARLSLIREQLERSHVESPFAGQIIDGDLSQSLGAPVQRGDVLLTLAPVDKYRVVFDVDESEIGHIEKGQLAEMALSSDPSKHYNLKISRISPMAKVKNMNNIFEVEATFPKSEINASTIKQLRPGLEGLVKIEVGKRAPFWIAFHRVGDWFSYQSWRWFGLK